MVTFLPPWLVEELEHSLGLPIKQQEVRRRDKGEELPEKQGEEEKKMNEKKKKTKNEGEEKSRRS